MEKQIQIYGKVLLPLSKSISNRLLLIQALMGEECFMEQLSDSDDTRYMFQALHSPDSCLDIGHAGTAMRFLTAFFAQKRGEWEITGSERMKQRPIKILVDSLRALGAQIEYVDHIGFPPLRIVGSELIGGVLNISASVSSQYISALLLIAPYMKAGLTLQLQGKVVSKAYIDMTIRIMEIFGAKVDRGENYIHITPTPYQSSVLKVESDWSAASYFFALLAVARNGELRLTGLQKDSIQGDSCQMELWEKLGVASHFANGELILTPKSIELSFLEVTLIDMPDLIPTFAGSCCLLEIPFRISGIETLHIKESNRTLALITELKKLGYLLEVEDESRLCWFGKKQAPEPQPSIQTYQDHRIAMAFSVASLKFTNIHIEDKEVVTKSYPRFWEELQNVIK